MLILQADRDALLKPLLAVTGIVERKHTLPILSNVLIERKDGAVRFLATDLDIQITTSAPESIEADQDFCLTTSAKKLQDILRAIPDTATVKFEQEGDRLTLRAGKGRFNLQTLPAVDFPSMKPNSEPESSFSLTQRELKHLLAQVQFAMAVQDIRYYLNGLLLQTEGDEVRLVATDGHRLAYASNKLASEQPKSEVILPRKTVLELHKLLQDSDELIQVELLNNQVRFSFGDSVVISKVVEGKYPDYNRVIPLDNDRIFLINRLNFLHALQRTAILANEKFRGVRLAIKPGMMSISCTNSEQEEAEEELEILYSGEQLEVAFNVNYLMDLLTNASAEQIQLAFGDAARSSLCTIPENPNFKYVVMPMRI